MSNRMTLPTNLTGATLSQSGEGVSRNNSSLASTPSISSGGSPMPAASPTAGISMASLFGNPGLGVATSPLATSGGSSSTASSMPSLSSGNSLSQGSNSLPSGSNSLSPGSMLPASNGNSNLLPANPLQGNTVKSPLVQSSNSSQPASFVPPPSQISPAQLKASVATNNSPFSNQTSPSSPATYSQTPLPQSLGQQSLSSTGSDRTSPRGQTSSKRQGRTSGRRQSSEINAPAPVEVDIVQPEVAPKRGWGYIFRPLNIIFLILVFIIVFITLYASKLNMTSDLQDGERVMNNRKLILWSVVITIVIAILGFIVMSAVAKRRR
jgi:hypothetical protein